jgi:hypothetical protein
LILIGAASNLGYEIFARMIGSARADWERFMGRVLAAVTLLAAATLPAQASAGSQGRMCVAKVLYSDELPFAPINFWLVRVALEIVPPDGNPYEIESQSNMPWQGPPPRRGQKFRLPCDQANRGDLHLIH